MSLVYDLALVATLQLYGCSGSNAWWRRYYMLQMLLRSSA